MKTHLPDIYAAAYGREHPTEYGFTRAGRVIRQDGMGLSEVFSGKKAEESQPLG